MILFCLLKYEELAYKIIGHNDDHGSDELGYKICGYGERNQNIYCEFQVSRRLKKCDCAEGDERIESKRYETSARKHGKLF